MIAMGFSGRKYSADTFPISGETEIFSVRDLMGAS